MPRQSITTKEIINNYGASFAFLITIIVFSIASRGFFSGQNLQNILVQSTSLGICAFGLTFVLMTGEIDMSYAGVIGLVGTVLASMLKEGHPIGWVTLICLGIGLGTGIINALLIVVFKLPSFLVTVAIMFLSMGAERVISQGVTTWIRQPDVLAIVQTTLGPIPVTVIYLFALFAACWFFQTQTKSGQYIRALGENINAVREVGIRAVLLKSIVFVIAGGLFAVAGYVETLRIGGGIMYAGKPLMVFVLAACFLGTATFKAGKVNFPGTLIGAFFLYTLLSGFTGLGLQFYFVPAAQGLILIISVAVSSIRRGKIEQVQF
jgi:ribose/xylose/arabinose/galactoside ABC-type transport system permease subunit